MYAVNLLVLGRRSPSRGVSTRSCGGRVLQQKLRRASRFISRRSSLQNSPMASRFARNGWRFGNADSSPSYSFSRGEDVPLSPAWGRTLGLCGTQPASRDRSAGAGGDGETELAQFMALAAEAAEYKIAWNDLVQYIKESHLKQLN